MSCDPYFWFFSTLAQSMAALIAVVGIFSIFRLEYINQQINSSMEAFKKWADKYLGSGRSDPDYATWLRKDVIYHILQAYEVSNENDARRLIPAILDYFTDIFNLMEFEKKIKRELWLPTLSIGLAFVLSIIGLFLMRSGCESQVIIFLEPACLVIAIFGFILSFRYIVEALRGPQPEYFNNPYANNDKLSTLRQKILANKKIEIERVIREENGNIEKHLRNEAAKKVRNQRARPGPFGHLLTNVRGATALFRFRKMGTH